MLNRGQGTMEAQHKWKNPFLSNKGIILSKQVVESFFRGKNHPDHQHLKSEQRKSPLSLCHNGGYQD